jgi:hypothetical protein
MWCGPAAIVLFLVGLWFVAGLIPPPSPAQDAGQIAELYRSHRGGIQVGMALLMLGAALIGPFCAEISTQMRRIQPAHSPLAAIQYGLGVAGIFVILLPAMTMQVAAFRPDRDPDLLLLVNDAAWLFLVGTLSLFIVQVTAIAACVLQDHDQLVFHRWVGYFNIWAALLVVPGLLIYFFTTGPFAWNGILVFWLGLTVLGAWFVVMTVALRRAIHTQPPDEPTLGAELAALRHRLDALTGDRPAR